MSLVSCASFCLKNAKVGVLSSRRLISNLHLRLFSSFGKSIGESMGKDPKVKKGIVKGNGANRDALEIQRIQDDVEKIDTMTVQELRTTLKSFGVPAKGLKRDLVSTLKCFLDGKRDDATHVCSEDLNSPQNPNGFESVPSLKRKANAENISDENDAQDIDDTVGASAIQKSKRQSKKSLVEKETLTVNKETITRKRKLVTSTLEVSDQTEPWTIFAHKKPQQGWIAYNPRTMRPTALANDTRSMKLMSWNVNGLRALLKLEGFSALQLAKREDFDVLCLQETKLQEKDIEAIKQSLIEGYENSFWTCSVSKLGYSGTAIISRNKPISVKYGLGISDHDTEGRLVTAEFDSFFLISAYVPNSGDGLRRLPYRISEWDPSLSNYMKDLEKLKPVILTGDLNCAHQEIDIYNPAGNKRSAGFTEEERKSFESNFLSRGFVDTFRKQHPGVVGYTYWGYRHGGRKTNKGWRLDYFLVSESIADKVHDSYILPDVTGSDHSPIGLILKL